MTLTTLTVEPKDIEEGDILISDLGQRVALPILYADGYWFVYSTRDRLIRMLAMDATVEVLRTIVPGVADITSTPWTWAINDTLYVTMPPFTPDEIVEGASDALRGAEPIAPSTPDDCPPHGITRSRGLYVVTP